MIYPNEADEWNALHLGALYNHPELIRILVQDYGIDIEVGLEASCNIVYIFTIFFTWILLLQTGATPLMVAGAANSIESFRMLLSLGSNTNAMETVSIPPLQLVMTCYI